MNKIVIVGVNEGGPATLTPAALDIIRNAGMLVGGKRLIAMWPDLPVEKIAIAGNLEDLADRIRANRHENIVVLASGDPGFFGIAKFLVQRFGKNDVEILPNVSSVQLAFARIKESWEDATFFSVHGRPLEDVVPAVRASRKIAILTDQNNSPAQIARLLLSSGLTDCTAYLCENLGSEEERVCQMDLETLAGTKAAPLSLLVLTRQDRANTGKWALGIPDEAFIRQGARPGLLTKREVRVISLAALCLVPGSIVWDIGAGIGSVAIEAARIARDGWVFAIEQNPTRAEDIQANMVRFGANNMTVITGRAEDALGSLPPPDAIFIGGSGGAMEQILKRTGECLRPGGRIVINLVTLENLNSALTTLKAIGMTVEITLVSIAKSTSVVDMTRLQPLDPVFVVTAWQESEEKD